MQTRHVLWPTMEVGLLRLQEGKSQVLDSVVLPSQHGMCALVLAGRSSAATSPLMPSPRTPLEPPDQALCSLSYYPYRTPHLLLYSCQGRGTCHLHHHLHVQHPMGHKEVLTDGNRAS